MACRFGWCDTPAKIHADDISYHTRELGHGMLLAVQTDGTPISNWMPDWDEWWIDEPGEIDTEYESVVETLRALPDNYRRFRAELLNDPLFADEVATMQARDKELRNRGRNQA
ncbi:hypothetical protein AB1285_02155 [Microbacterium sp. NRRL B-14842]|uniref:hypothetical protein n=1 Tax=Microbacterium sp. NRRL B-14842 TaxID=3162881 RepID=UPI0035134E66